MLDRAILQHQEIHQHLAVAEYAKVDEIPFDFTRRMMSVVVATPDGQASADLQGRAGGGLQPLHAVSSWTENSTRWTHCCSTI